MTPEQIAEVAKRMGWTLVRRIPYDGGDCYDSGYYSTPEATLTTISTSGIIVLLEWALANGWEVNKRSGEYTIGTYGADTLAEALVLARLSSET